jgi:hypothetical protein
MAIGNNTPFFGFDSAVGVAKETTFGTFVTATTFIEFNSEGFKQERDSKTLESINASRDPKKRLTFNENISGSIEAELNLASDGIINILKQGMGGTCSSVVTSAGVSYTHTLWSGDMENNKPTSTGSDMKSLSFQVRKGSTHVWCYAGMRANTLSFKAESGGPVVFSSELIGQTCSITSTIPAISVTDVNPCTFVGVTVQTGATTTSLATEYFKSFELTINNNLDGEQRVLGSRNVVCLPPKRRETKLKFTQIFDTITAYNRFLAETITAIKISITGPTIASSSLPHQLDITLPRCYFKSNMPTVGGPDPIMLEMECDVLYDSTLGSAVKMEVTNGTAAYA